jgi:tetratricopeptide (TPR) repeat protein
MIGRTLGHYRVVEKIGAGAMGVVYRAHDDRLDRDVAIKVLPEGAIADDAALRRFRNEALALSRTSHPSIATIHDFDAHDGVHFLVMEYIPGQTLSQRLAAGALPEREVVRLGIGLADGLTAAHAQGVVHRDLKPSNLKLTPDGRLKILDFGIARLRPTSSETTRSEIAGHAAGTLPYMAPEQFDGHEGDARTDIFSAGAVLYEMATGQRAHPGPNDAQVIRQILDEVPPTPRQLSATISQSLEAVILKALDKDPDRRYQSARELLVDLQRIAAPGTTGIGTRRPLRLFGRSVPRRRVQLGAAVIVLAVTTAAVFLFHDLAQPQRPAGQTRGPVKMTVLRAENLAGHDIDEWPDLIRALFAGELTGLQNVGIVDAQSLRRVDRSGATDDPASHQDLLMSQLKAAGVSLAIGTQITRTADGYDLRANLLETATGEINFSSHTPLPDEKALASAVGTLARAIVSYLQLQVLDVTRSQDLRPWVSYRTQNIEAVKAFMQANQYMGSEGHESERYLHRAIDVDPSFVAPRVWLIPTLLSQGRQAEAEEHYRHLLTLEPTASPFEQTMIQFAGSVLQKDLASQGKHLEIALQYSPGNSILLVNLGAVRFQMGDCKKALDAFDPLVASRWPYPRFYSTWGWCEITEDRLDEARAGLQVAAEMEPVHPTVYALLEALCIAADMPDEASRYARLCAKRSQETGATGKVSGWLIKIWEHLAARALETGAYRPAAELDRKVVAAEPEVARHHERLAEALRRQGLAADAEAEFTLALHLDLKDLRPHLGLAALCEQRGKLQAAAAHYEAFIAKSEAGSDLTAAREQLDRIRQILKKPPEFTRR